MIGESGGATRARRWGRIVCLGLTASLLGGCATDKMGPKPPTHCSAARARPANPNGSVLVQSKVIGAAPDGSTTGAGVMVFGSDADPAKPESAQPNAVASPDTVVPALPAQPSTKAAGPRRRGRPISMGPQPAQGRTFYRSC